MSPDSPDKVVSFLAQPLVPQRLDVKVVHLETGVVHMVFWTCIRHM